MVPPASHPGNEEFDENAARSEKRVSSFINNISEIVTSIDAGGVIRFMSPQVERVLGYPSSDLVGQNIFDFVHPEDKQRAALEYSQTVQQEGEGVPSVLRLRDAAGAWVPFEIIANNRLQDPEIRGVIFTARDMRFRKEIEDAIRRANSDIEKQVGERTTELAKANAALRIENQSRRQTERRLHEAVSLLNATLESTADGILVISADGTVRSCNHKFLEMWRIDADSVLGRSDETLRATAALQLRNPQEFLSKVQELYANSDATSFDLLYFRDGRIFERFSQPQRVADRIVGRVWSFRDVTESKRLEEELRHAQKMEAVGRLAGGIAHDFNNLLMLISGYITQLYDDPSQSRENKIVCEQVIAATKRAAGVTRQLLSFSRKQQVTPMVADLNVIVLDVERMLGRLLSDTVRLEISVRDVPLPVYVDTSQIELVLMNLAINAQDAMPNGGLLSVRTDQEVIALNGDPGPEAYAVIEVSDTGEGMTPEVQAHIFEPFFTTKQVGKGTGLGLSTVYGIVKGINGHIRVQSEPNRGSTFRVYLPQSRATAAPTTALPPQQPPRRGHETILLAEDEGGIRAMTRVYLEGLGYRVLEATDGLEAVRVSMEYKGSIDLLITDIMMPGMRGDAVATAIRGNRPRTKALFISGFADDNPEHQGPSFLQKPFEFPELGRQVRSILDSNSGHAEFAAD